MAQDSLADRIRNSGPEIMVSHSELSREIIGYFSRKDDSALKTLSDAFVAWESRNFGADQHIARTYSLSYIEFLAALADTTDGGEVSGEDLDALYLSFRTANPPVGPVREFCRRSLCYHPSERFYISNSYDIFQDGNLKRITLVSFLSLN
ncbi:hypothetical protein JW968_02455 [Candidatus Woesearchaeota archaeon]|nr:hypothetical protein [Candidatus Woesearchaeota archaeon]